MKLLQDTCDAVLNGHHNERNLSPETLRTLLIMQWQDIADMERRCHAAELRHQELTAKIPETARPLLRQIEAMQVSHAFYHTWVRPNQLIFQQILS